MARNEYTHFRIETLLNLKHLAPKWLRLTPNVELHDSPWLRPFPNLKPHDSKLLHQFPNLDLLASERREARSQGPGATRYQFTTVPSPVVTHLPAVLPLPHPFTPFTPSWITNL